MGSQRASWIKTHPNRWQLSISVSNHRPGKQPISPFEDGFSMPAEWAPHEATWLAWPNNPEAWPKNLKAVQDIWVEIARVLSLGEKVRLLVHDDEVGEDVSNRLKNAGADMKEVSLLKIPTVDIWIRDYGPTFVTRRGGENRVAANSWVFNAWGEKYESWLKDDGVARQVAHLLQVPLYESSLILEGGSIEVNGQGTCLLTEQCLLNSNRNARLSRREIERTLVDYLGVTHFIWLGQGVAGDDTDGHIDNLARFVNPTTVVCPLEEDSRDENYTPLQENHERLQRATDHKGEKLQVVTLPVPGRVVDGRERLPASYANFYIANETVLVPVYDHPNDEKAIDTLDSLFPERKVIGIPCRSLVYGLGAIHCMTQQEPAPPTT